MKKTCGLILAMACAVSFSKVRLALNWKPEPQFGGFYAAVVEKLIQEKQIDLEIIPGGSGTPTAQMVAAGSVELGVSSADSIVIARDRGMPVTALMAVYQNNPHGIMTHPERGFKSIGDVFAQPGTVSLQKGMAYSLFLEKRFGFKNVKIVPYAGGVANFLADPALSQQCFVTSEPLLAKRQGQDPKTFLVAEAGFNPYTTVLVARQDWIDANQKLVATLVSVFRESWKRYLADPTKTNERMHQLNPTMDLETFLESAQAQRPLILSGDALTSGVGTMTDQRWQDISRQLKDLGLIQKVLSPKTYYWVAAT